MLKLIGFLFAVVVIYVVNTMTLPAGLLTGRDVTVEKHEYMVEDSKKNFSDVKVMPEILAD